MWKWRHTSLTEALNESQNHSISVTSLDKNLNNNLYEIYKNTFPTRIRKIDQNLNVKLVLSNFNFKC